MFPGLDPLCADPHASMRAGGSGGICATASIPGGADDATEAAGWPFFGQLIAHDITADRSPIAGGVTADGLRDARTPASYLSRDPAWDPTLPTAGPRFGLADLPAVGVDSPELSRAGRAARS